MGGALSAFVEFGDRHHFGVAHRDGVDGGDAGTAPQPRNRHQPIERVETQNMPVAGVSRASRQKADYAALIRPTVLTK